MATTPTFIFAANIPFQTRLRLLSPPSSPSLVVKCCNPPHINNIGDTESSKLIKNGGVGFNNVLSGTKIELAQIQKQETKAMNMDYLKFNHLETIVSEIADVKKESSEPTTVEEAAMYKNKEKLESIKAASISAIVGTLASLLISLTHVTNASSDLKVSTAITVISCALYGATFRYTVRRDLDDFHLKTGTSAAFGIVKGVATLNERPSLGPEAGSLLAHAFDGAVCVSENVLVFLFAAAGLDICYKMGILSPFPLERSVSRTKM